MTTLERRAILGDAEAQRECTEKGIVLTCACCGSTAHVLHKSLYKVCCDNVLCGNETLWQFDKASAIGVWNTRPAPPIGRCWECGAYTSEGPGLGYCSDGTGKTDDGYCDCFYPKGGEENG